MDDMYSRSGILLHDLSHVTETLSLSLSLSLLLPSSHSFQSPSIYLTHHGGTTHHHNPTTRTKTRE